MQVRCQRLVLLAQLLQLLLNALLVCQLLLRLLQCGHRLAVRLLHSAELLLCQRQLGALRLHQSQQAGSAYPLTRRGGTRRLCARGRRRERVGGTHA